MSFIDNRAYEKIQYEDPVQKASSKAAIRRHSLVKGLVLLLFLTAMFGAFNRYSEISQWFGNQKSVTLAHEFGSPQIIERIALTYQQYEVLYTALLLTGVVATCLLIFGSFIYFSKSSRGIDLLSTGCVVAMIFNFGSGGLATIALLETKTENCTSLTYEQPAKQKCYTRT